MISLHIQINVNADLFARAASCISTDPTRYYLNGVHVEPFSDGEGVIMVSTDGHSLIAIRDPSGSIEGGTAIVSANKQILDACKKGDGLVTRGSRRFARRLLASDGRLSVVAEPFENEPLPDFTVCTEPGKTVIAFQWRNAFIDGKFPEWRRTLPKIAPDFSKYHSGFQPTLLERIGRSLSSESVYSLIAVKTNPDDDLSPAWVVCPNSQKTIDGFGLIVPMRNIDPVIPSWIAFGEPDAQKTAAE